MAGSSPTVAQRRLARALRRLRANADLTIDQVAEKFDLSASTISRLETAQASARKGDVRELLDIYEVTGTQREELLQLAGQSRRQPWWQEYKDLPETAAIDLEAEALVIRQFAAQLVPGILQTEAYAREVLHFVLGDEEPESRERHLRLRMNRQALFAERKSPKHEIVLDEAVLRRAVGGPQVMQAQVERLIEASKLRSVTLQVLPFATGAHAAMDSQFTIYSYQSSDRRIWEEVHSSRIAT